MSLNVDQKLAVDSRDKHILTLAGPGAGKTFTMLQRISALIDEGRDPKSFLVLTFTNAAAFEMKERYRKLHPGERSIPEFRTFHSFCYSLLCKDKKVRTKLRYSKVPNIISEYDEKKLKTEAAKLIDCKLSNKQIAGIDPLGPKDRFQYELLLKTIDDMMYERNLITFDKLCYNICSLFVEKDEVIQKYFDKYFNIFVDEFQDTDSKQWRFVRSFENADVFLVADALQAIYGFRGADSSIVKSIASSGDYKVIKLHENYRSTTPICDYINNFSKYANDSYRILIHSAKSGPEIDIENVGEYAVYGTISSKSLSTMMEKLLNYKELGTTAILARTNKEVYAISEYLNSVGIEHVVGKSNERVINLLKSMYDEEYLFHWLTVRLSDNEYTRFLRLQSIEESKGEEYTFEKFKDDFATNYVVMSTLQTIREAKLILEKGYLFEEDPEVILKEFKSSIKLRRSISKPESSDPYIIVNTCLSSLDASEEGSIYVGTVHSSKGLEYDSVIVMGANSYSFQLTSEDNKNLYYVAISRAKTNLCIIKGT